MIVVGARQSVLGADHFDVVGYARLEAVAGLGDFLLREVDPQIGNIHFVLCRFKLRSRGFDLERDLALQIVALLVDFLEFEIRLGDLGANPAAREKGNIDADLIT